MGVLSRLHRLRLTASRPEPSPAGGRPASHRPLSPSDSSGPSPACAKQAGSRRAGSHRRRGLLPALLALPLLAVFATGAQAQVECSSANSDGSYTVPEDWPLTPSGIAAEGKFRLLFFSVGRESSAQATNIGHYNTHVQNSAKAGHSAITDSCGNRFKVVGSTSTVDARDNAATTGTGVPIYWLNGAKVADDYADFYDGSWDSVAKRSHLGRAVGSDYLVWTGSQANGTPRSILELAWSATEVFVALLALQDP